MQTSIELTIYMSCESIKLHTFTYTIELTMSFVHINCKQIEVPVR